MYILRMITFRSSSFSVAFVHLHEPDDLFPVPMQSLDPQKQTACALLKKSGDGTLVAEVHGNITAQPNENDGSGGQPGLMYFLSSAGLWLSCLPGLHSQAKLAALQEDLLSLLAHLTSC